MLKETRFPWKMSITDFANIKAIAFDFDGVFTDNRVLVSENGVEYSMCNRYDGFGIMNLANLGIHMCCITSESVPISLHRCQKLSLPHFCVGNSDKLLELTKWLNSLSIHQSNAAYLGNDINDISCMHYVGYPFCPADSHVSVHGSAHRLSKTGGDGVVRELADLITTALLNK